MGERNSLRNKPGQEKWRQTGSRGKDKGKHEKE
jgi:hypothetical protein